MPRYDSLEALMRNISPDVIVEGTESGEKTPAQKKLSKASKEAQRVAREVLEQRFLALWEQLDGPHLVREHEFHPKRKWRFDFADVDRKIAIEIQGGLYKAESGHRSMSGVLRDAEKLNEATLLGWKVFQLNTKSMADQDFMQRLLVLFLSE